MSSRSPRSSHKSSGYHSPRSHSPRAGHSHRSSSPSSTRSSHSPRSRSPKSTRSSHSPRSHSPSADRHSRISPHRHSSYIAKKEVFTETTTTTTKSPHRQREEAIVYTEAHSPRHPNRHNEETIITTTQVHSPRHHSTDSRRGHRNRHSDDTVITEIRGQLQPTAPVSKKAEVVVATRETWDLEALQKLEEKLAVEKSALVDIQKTRNDQKTLYNDAKKTAEKRFLDSDRINRLVSERAAERDRLLEEEKELERRRAAIHAKAVEVENERANFVAQAVLAKEEARASESIASQRKEGIKQAKALEEAHLLAIQRLEQHRMELKRKEVDVHVRGDAIPQPREVDINVNVLPKALPEARITSDAVYRGADLKSHLEESLPHRSKTVLSPRSVRAAEAHRQTTTVERHVVSERDRAVM